MISSVFPPLRIILINKIIEHFKKIHGIGGTCKCIAAFGSFCLHPLFKSLPFMPLYQVPPVYAPVPRSPPSLRNGLLQFCEANRK